MAISFDVVKLDTGLEVNKTLLYLSYRIDRKPSTAIILSSKLKMQFAVEPRVKEKLSINAR